MIITIPFKTPTINHLYWHKGNIKIIKKEARELREKIKEIVDNLPIIIMAGNLKVNIDIHEDWLCKDGSVKRKDILNREKFLVDSVFDALGIDDKYIYEHTMRKVQSKKEFAIVTILSL